MIKSMNIAFGIAQLNYPVKAKAYQQNVFIQFFKHATPIKKYHVILYKVSLLSFLDEVIIVSMTFALYAHRMERL